MSTTSGKVKTVGILGPFSTSRIVTIGISVATAISKMPLAVVSPIALRLVDMAKSVRPTTVGILGPFSASRIVTIDISVATVAFKMALAVASAVALRLVDMVRSVRPTES